MATQQIYAGINLTCNMQTEGGIQDGTCYTGVLSKAGDGYLFEEEAPAAVAPHRNTKLYKGELLSMTRQKNGKYAFHMRKIDATRIGNHYEFIHTISNELLQALDHIN